MNEIEERKILLYIDWILEQCNSPAQEIRHLISMIQDKTLSYEGKMKVLKNDINWTLEELAEVNQ